MGEIKGNVEAANNSDIDIDQPVRETDVDKVIEMDAAAEINRIIDRREEEDNLDENKKDTQ